MIQKEHDFAFGAETAALILDGEPRSPKRLPARPPRTEKFLAEVKEFCDQKLGRRSELARFLGEPRQTITNLLNGRSSPTGEQVLAIHDFLRRKEKMMFEQLAERLGAAKRNLVISLDCSTLNRSELEQVAHLLLELKRRIKELSVPVLARIEQLDQPR
jgi:transcriptional regulator with XRE-family HTH domain